MKTPNLDLLLPGVARVLPGYAGGWQHKKSPIFIGLFIYLLLFVASVASKYGFGREFGRPPAVQPPATRQHRQQDYGVVADPSI
jgi:hypothetical protein